MASASYYWDLQQRMYGTERLKQRWRGTIFFLRCLCHKKLLCQLDHFFDHYEPLPHYTKTEEYFIDVINRVFLFKNSTAAQRLTAIIQHFTILEQLFTPEAIRQMYSPEGYTLWQSDDETLPLLVRVIYLSGQRKEGFLTLHMTYEGHLLYQINFRFAYNPSGEVSIYIGTIQGTPDGLSSSKKVTKKLFGYRPKNFIIHIMRIYAQTIGVRHLYAISDAGFYTNSHLIRGNRSKKTVFDPFWLDLGGSLSKEEPLFYDLPQEETRKSYEEIKPHKRNLYRKRFALLDTIIPIVHDKVCQILLGPSHLPESQLHPHSEIPYMDV